LSWRCSTDESSSGGDMGVVSAVDGEATSKVVTGEVSMRVKVERALRIPIVKLGEIQYEARRRLGLKRTSCPSGVCCRRSERKLESQCPEGYFLKEGRPGPPYLTRIQCHQRHFDLGRFTQAIGLPAALMH
jgi:hypothetical protein